MAKKLNSKSARATKIAGGESAAVRLPIFAVAEGDRRSSEELMKLPKAQIIREMAIPKNKTRFMVDVDNQSKQGKRIIALMESLRDGNAAATKTATEILAALANMVD